MNESTRLKLLSLSKLSKSRKSEPHQSNNKFISNTKKRRGRSRSTAKYGSNSNSKSGRYRSKGNRKRLSSLTQRHERHKSITKEHRLLSTWSKIEIAEWLQKHWNGSNAHDQNTSKLLSYVHKIKRDKKFDGKHLCKLNDRYLNILAQRCLGLKKGGADYKVFMHSMHELQRTYCANKRNSALHPTRYPSFNKPATSKKYKGSKAKLKPQHITAFPFSTNNLAPHTPTMIHLSVTSPACSEDERYGVTADELLTLISCGQLHSDYDYESSCDAQHYIYQNISQTPSPKDLQLAACGNEIHKDINKITVVPSILTVSDQITPTIALSPLAAHTGDTVTYYSMTDESTDEEESTLKLHR